MQNGYGQFQPQRAVFPSTWFGRLSCVICSSIPRLSRVSCELGSTPGLGGAKVDEMNTLLEGLGAEPGQVQKQDGVPGVFYTFRKDIEEYKDIWSAPGRGETKPAWGEEEKYISVRSWDVRRGLSNASYQTVVQSQGAALADPQRRGCRAYSGTGQSMRAQSGMHSGRGGLKLQEGRVRRGLVSRLERILCHGVSEGVLCHADILQQLQSRGWMQRLDAGRPAWAPRLWCSPSSETQPRHCFRKSSLPMAGARTCASWRCYLFIPYNSSRRHRYLSLQMKELGSRGEFLTGPEGPRWWAVDRDWNSGCLWVGATSSVWRVGLFHPPVSLFSASQTWTPPVFRSHPARSLGPLCVLGLHLPPASSNAILLKTLKVHNFVEDRKTILFASQLHSIFIFRCVNTS